MFAGYLIVAALSAPPTAPVPPPGADAHKDALSRFGAAIWNSRRERLLTSARQLEEAARDDPKAVEPRRELVRIYTLLGREPDAIRIARQILVSDPDDFETAHSLAKLLFDAGEFKEAVAAARLASTCPMPIARADRAVGVYRDLATLCEKANEPAAAEAALGKAIELVVEKRSEVVAARALTPREADRIAAECYERLGKVLTKLRKYEEAAAAYSTAAKLFSDPLKADDASALTRLDWNLSSVLQAKGDSQAALDHLDRVLKLQPLFPEPYLRLAQLLRELNRENEVVTMLQRLERKDEKNLALLTVLAVELGRTGSQLHASRADRLIETIMKETNEPVLMTLVLRSYLERGRPGQIVADLDRVFTRLKDSEKEDKNTPEAAAARTFAAAKARAIAEILREDADAAAKILEAVRQDLRAGAKRTHQTYYFLGQIAARHNKLGLAEALYQDAVFTAPRETKADAYLGWIDVLRMAGKPAQLAEACRRGLLEVDAIAPFFFNYYLSEALAELGKADEAIATAEKAIQETGHSDRLNVKLHKAVVLRILGKYDEAIELTNKLLDEFPAAGDRLQTRYCLATTYWLAGKHPQSEAELRAILEIDPDHAEACNDLGYHLAEAGRNLEEAERLIRHAIEVDRYDRRKTGAAVIDNALYIDSLGWTLFRQGKLPQARAELERALSFYAGASDPIVWDHLGDVLFRLGDKPGAKAAWEKVAELYGKEARASHRSEDRLEEAKRKLKRIP
jgi:tetratricopeptide (TPR) repeat protein